MNYLIIAILLILLFLYFKTRSPADLNSDGLKKALESNAPLIDVRSPGEFASGHIPGAINIPVDQLEKVAKKKLKDKEQRIILCCRSGARSRRGKSLLENMGYTKIEDFGAIHHWNDELEKGS
ncbi:MAG: rhodanese-like domain-containing protein [Tissierellia bacterium]|nr:rhodanese-like domain-containing protein [Tissierellia bacterium]